MNGLQRVRNFLVRDRAHAVFGRKVSSLGLTDRLACTSVFFAPRDCAGGSDENKTPQDHLHEAMDVELEDLRTGMMLPPGSRALPGSLAK